ncbi:HAD family hydrolase [Dubosiella newyorkensis]|jgi:FMN phosphatase YigB (HAD superfamily)|uniref:HAD family hydrolase n=1 Tax=Dubosiella newyorkensis TaxID=1862672 RepID=UPI002353522B|nr:HAD family hydrolase [Dubosiella newyorkensis]
MLNTILFDLDGTLLPMDLDEFIQYYFKAITKTMASSFDSKRLIHSIWNGTQAMLENNGQKTNEDVFWDRMQQEYGQEIIHTKSDFERFYQNEFQSIQHVCPKNEQVAALIEQLKKENLTLLIATNPIFPAIATFSRVRWAGLDPADFKTITTYENSHACKPNLLYYEELIKIYDLDPETCLMVGNNVEEDMIARQCGMHVFLLTDHLLNPRNENIDQYPHGDIDALLEYIKKLQSR